MESLQFNGKKLIMTLRSSAVAKFSNNYYRYLDYKQINSDTNLCDYFNIEIRRE